MIKSVIPALAVKLGKSPAFLLNQLKTLMGSFNKTKIYRTNKQLTEDMEGVIGLTAIKNAKKKLVEEGYIIISFDGHLNRQTYYQFTDKAIQALAEYKVKNEVIFKLSDGTYPIITLNNQEKNPKAELEVKDTDKTVVNHCKHVDKQCEEPTLPSPVKDVPEAPQVASKGKTKPPKYFFAKPERRVEEKTQKEESALASTKTMRESFEEGFSNKNAVPMPAKSLRELRKQMVEEPKRDLLDDKISSQKLQTKKTTNDESFDLDAEYWEEQQAMQAWMNVDK